MQFYKENKPVEEFLGILQEGTEANPNKQNKEIKDGIRQCNWDNDDDKRAAIIASRYLNSLGKGTNALELAYALDDNLRREGQEAYQHFVVPSYIANAIEWICQ